MPSNRRSKAYAAEIAALRRDGVTRTLTDDAAERFFALGFALEQMHNNFNDLGRCVAEWAEPVKKTGRGESVRLMAAKPYFRPPIVLSVQSCHISL